MSKSILITRSNHDEATRYLYFWSTLVIKAAKKKKLKIYDLAAKKANKKTFDKYLTKKPSLIFLNGHGNAVMVTGQNLEPLLQVGDKTEIAGTIIYARSCDAGISLGRSLINKGARAFVGYNQKFIVGYSPKKVDRPLSDPLAKLFLDPSNLIVITLTKGHSVKRAHNWSRQAMLHSFKKMSLDSAPKSEQYAALWLWSNYKSQVLYGDPEATY